MSATDPVADFLTRVRNGLQADHDAVVMPASRLKVEMARILTEQGYVESYDVEPGRVGPDPARDAEVHRGPQAGDHGHAARVQAAAGARYVSAGEVPQVQGGMGTAIVSTSRGVMTGHDARRAGVGGELVAKVW